MQSKINSGTRFAFLMNTTSKQFNLKNQTIVNSFQKEFIAYKTFEFKKETVILSE